MQNASEKSPIVRFTIEREDGSKDIVEGHEDYVLAWGNANTEGIFAKGDGVVEIDAEINIQAGPFFLKSLCERLLIASNDQMNQYVEMIAEVTGVSPEDISMVIHGGKRP